MNYDAVSKSYIVLGCHGDRKQRFYLDEAALEDGEVRAPDGTGEQCDDCGEPLCECDVTANAHGMRIVCCCGAVYAVQVKS